MTISTTDEPRVARAHLTATILVTALSAVLLLSIMLLVAGDLPDRLATHFDVSGVPDDDMASAMAMGMFALVGIGLPALLVGIFATTQWWRGDGARAFSGLLAGLPVGLTTLFVGLVLANRGAAAPDEVRLSPWLMLLSALLAIAVGMVVGGGGGGGGPRPPPAAGAPGGRPPPPPAARGSSHRPSGPRGSVGWRWGGCRCWRCWVRWWSWGSPRSSVGSGGSGSSRLSSRCSWWR